MIVKRSLSIRGHRTSISLEDPFWTFIREIAGKRGMSLAATIAEIDDARSGDENLSSAIRVFVLRYALENGASPEALVARNRKIAELP